MLAAPAAALACTDGGPPNRACNDGGAQWIGCTDHAQCPEGQYCSARGACACGSRDAGVCDDRGCHDCVPRVLDGGPDSGLRCVAMTYVCPDPGAADATIDTGTVFTDAGVVDTSTALTDAAVDAGTVVDTGTAVDVMSVDVVSVDAGGGGGGGGCAVHAPGDRTARSPLAVLAALVGIAGLARVRRRR
ncbi:MAG: hypothetical protein Q8S73_37525 [Deltaproteobacteria bacterium]|nr:hypothetical protein [Myxococcales bacterium]MDP3219864.1 hypothetical protein [Deltaproteobacteria bacterium]